MKRSFMTILGLSLVTVLFVAGPASAHHRRSSNALKARVAALEARAAALEARAAALESKTATLQTKTSTLDSQVSTLITAAGELQSKTSLLNSGGFYSGPVAAYQVFGLGCDPSDAYFFPTAEAGTTVLDCTDFYPRQGADAATGNSSTSSLSSVDMAEIRAAAAARRK